ncbi:MAG: T9SS type A sorting domain-containing protein [Bacteroidota bacterium]
MKTKVLLFLFVIGSLPFLVFGQGIILTPGAMVTVQNNACLKASGSAGITVKSDETKTGSFLDQNSSGSNVTFVAAQSNVERYLTANAWHLLFVPLSSQTANIFLNDYMRNYDEVAGEWSSWIVPIGTPLSTSYGYEVWVATNPATRTFTNGTIATGTKTFSLTNTAGKGGGWNLIGNPYPSAIDIHNSVSYNLTNVDPTFYMYNGTQYASYNHSTNVSNLATRYIPSMQGFFVHCNAPTGSLEMTNACRVHNASQAYYKSLQAEQIPNLLRLKATGNNLSDETVIHFWNGATADFDSEFDAYKLSGISEAPQIYSLTSDLKKASINALPTSLSNAVVNVGLEVGVNGNYTITASELESFSENVSIILEDLRDQKNQNLRVAPTYEFFSDTTDNPERFRIHFANLPFAVNDFNTQPKIRIYSSGSTVFIAQSSNETIKGKVVIFDILGRILYSADQRVEQLEKINMNVVNGYYFVRMISDDFSVVQKVYIQNAL